MLFCTFRYRTAAHLHLMEAAAAQLYVRHTGHCSMMRLIGTFEVDRARRQAWQAGVLQGQWAAAYPQLFDDLDVQLATGPQGDAGYHFAEWLGAIILHHVTGYHSLIAKYQLPKHVAKRTVVRELGLANLLFRKHSEYGGTHGPDLLMYAPDRSAYFFCEVKGPGDALSPRQEKYFLHLEKETGSPIRMLKFKWTTRAKGA